MVHDPSELTRAVTQQLTQILQGEPEARKLAAALRLLAKWRAQVVENTYVARSGVRVANGPFAGMVYDVRASEGARLARLLGCYEATLIPIIEAIIAARYDLVIDVGSAEGYYAVGLARAMPHVEIWARDANPVAQERCAVLARANGVAAQVHIGGLMEHGDFDVCDQRRSCVICDIEGAEVDLLDPERAPGLRAADILVEVHEGMVPGALAKIKERFSPTHEIVQLGREASTSALPDWMEGLSDLDRLIAVCEWRASPTPWLWMASKHE